MKNKKNLIANTFKIFLGTLVLFSHLVIPITALAQPACGDLVDPKKIKDYIFTVLEERISGPGNSQQDVEKNLNNEKQGVLYCWRKTACTTAANPDNPSKEIRECKNPTYEEKCSQEGGNFICQPVQIIYAKSGADILYTYVGLIYRWAAGTVGIVTVLYMVIGGVQMSMAQGDQGKYEKAKEHIMNSIAGLVLLFMSALILYTINPNFFVIE